MRYTGYVRISSEDQVGNYSMEAQVVAALMTLKVPDDWRERAGPGCWR